MPNEKQSPSRSLLWLIMVLPVVLVVADVALAAPTAAGKTHASKSKTHEGKPTAGTCSFSENIEAWGVGGSAGWAREWLVGQCDLADSSVITYVGLVGNCAPRTDPASCRATNLLGACGGTQVTLIAEECRNCSPACITLGATCVKGHCSNTGKPCANPENCTFSKPINGACASGATLVKDWAQYYALQSSSTAGAPLTYCAWK
jgi:hypothetical protein